MLVSIRFLRVKFVSEKGGLVLLILNRCYVGVRRCIVKGVSCFVNWMMVMLSGLFFY